MQINESKIYLRFTKQKIYREKNVLKKKINNIGVWEYLKIKTIRPKKTIGNYITYYFYATINYYCKQNKF